MYTRPEASCHGGERVSLTRRRQHTVPDLSSEYIVEEHVVCHLKILIIKETG